MYNVTLCYGVQQVEGHGGTSTRRQGRFWSPRSQDRDPKVKRLGKVALHSGFTLLVRITFIVSARYPCPLPSPSPSTSSDALVVVRHVSLHSSADMLAAAPPAQHPFSSKTNLTTRTFKVHFKLPVIKKASPTVSVTNTNAARVITDSQPSPALPEVSFPSSVPFPSSPIPCPSRKRAISEDGYDLRDECEETGDEPMDVDEPNETKGSTLPFHRRISHIDIIRRRSKSCLAASYFHSDSQQPRRSRHASDKPVPPPHGPEQPARKRPAMRRESMSAGTPLPKTVRKARRVVADAQFLASLHSSIAVQVRTRVNSGVISPDDDCATQDAILVERIWHALVDLGYKPVPLDDAPPSQSSSAAAPPPPPTPAVDPAREAAERAARRTKAVSSGPFVFGTQDLPPPSSGPVPVPQLVASLIMRHRDRTSTRPRAASKKRAGDQYPASRSPLSQSATTMHATIDI